MQNTEKVEQILQELMNRTKEIRYYFTKVKTKVDCLIGTLFSEEEEKKIEQVPTAKIEQILSQNAFSFEVAAKSETIYTRL